MNIPAIAVGALPVIFAVLQLRTYRYIFSALTTAFSAVAATVFALLYGGAFPWFLVAGLVMSVIGDYFMAHKKGPGLYYVLGIAGFFAAHALFVVHAASRGVFSAGFCVFGAMLTVGYGVYLFCRALKKVPQFMKAPVVLYSLISSVGFTCALMTGNMLYILGVGALLFSDTMIAENDFVGNTAAGKWILPTYYLSNILIGFSPLLK